MPRKVSEAKKDEIIARADIVELIAEHVSLKKSGRLFKGLCPFHAEKTPSFYVDREKAFFKCYGCGVGGDAFSFVMAHERVSFPEALQLLARRAGVQLDYERGDSTASANYFDVTAAAMKFYHRLLLESSQGRKARDYLKSRSINEESVKAFRIGYGGDGWDPCIKYLRKKGFKDKAIESAGLGIRNDRGNFYDRFRGRLIFPIFKTGGRVAGFGGRLLEDAKAAKYVNSPETPYFKKSELLFGLNLSRRAVVNSSRAIVVEGYTDVIMGHQHGLENVVATLGTALTADHVMQLKRLGVEATLVFDGDDAGQKAANKSLSLFLAHDVEARVVTLEGGLDPCETLERDGADGFLEQIENGRDLLEFKLDTIGQAFDLSSIAGRSKAVTELAELLSNIDGLNVVKQNFLVQKVSKFFGISENELRLALRRKRRRTRPGDDNASAEPSAEETLGAAQAWILAAMLEGGDLMRDALAAIDLEEFTGASHRRLIEAVSGMDAPRDFDEVLRQLTDADLRQLAVTIFDDPNLKKLDPEARRQHRRALLGDAIEHLAHKRRKPDPFASLRRCVTGRGEVPVS